MNLYPVLAQSAIFWEPCVGLSITSLLGSLGAAGAAIAVTRYFLGFLQNRETKQARIVEDFRGFHAESQKKFQDQLDRLSHRQAENQHDFQDQVDRMTESQNIILRDTIGTMKGMENTFEFSSTTIHGVEESIGSLRLTVRAVDILLHETINI
jgi:hypothetical protein